MADIWQTYSNAFYSMKTYFEIKILSAQLMQQAIIRTNLLT